MADQNRSADMAEFRQYLSDCGLTDESIAVLSGEMVVEESVLIKLERDHIFQLLPAMKVGQHALLLKLWKTMKDKPQLHSRVSLQVCNFSMFSASYFFIKSVEAIAEHIIMH